VAGNDAVGVVLLKLMVLGQKNGPTRQAGYLWNAESKLYKIGMVRSAGFTVKQYESIFLTA
jgi:hypothetical protein